MTRLPVRVVLALALPCSVAMAQQALVVQECFAQLTVQGTPVRQSVLASTAFGNGTGFGLRVNHPAGASYGGIGMALNLLPDHVIVSTSGSGNYPPTPHSGATGGELLVTLPPGRGLLHLVGFAQATGGPGTGHGSITVDIGANGSIEMTAFPHTWSWYGETSVFVDSATPVPVRIVVIGTLYSSLFDHFSTSVDLWFLPDMCPDTAYGPACFPMSSEPRAGFLDYSIDWPLAFLVFGFQPVNLPISGSTCRQLVSLDIVAGIFAGTWHQSLLPLPPGFQLFAQAVRFGPQITTSNGISLICPP